MKLFKRIAVFACAVLFLAALVPASSFAVDPVSAATMANAFAQAITAYGASYGVSMTFDVSSADGIGEGVHDLWEQYRADAAQNNVTVSDYSNLAASVFPTLWSKTFNYITANLDASTVGEVDGFWNWLLSGPAEMTKVDNSYYEWTVNNQNTVTPINVFLASTDYLNGLQVIKDAIPISFLSGGNTFTITLNGTYYPSTPIYATYTTDNYIFLLSKSSYNLHYSWGINQSLSSVGNWYERDFSIDSGSSPFTNGKTFNEMYSWMQNSSNSNPTLTEVVDKSISVAPYVGDAVPQDVYIPDNEDVNYQPVGVAIPLDVLWDDSLFGDGTASLTDAQSEAVTDALSDVITQSDVQTLELADTVDPTPPGTEVYIPLLPVQLPSFNFSFSGIWHYVVTWVGSLGSWLSLMFSVWNSLPYAIVVPVYASAVVVIILGTLKRFL